MPNIPKNAQIGQLFGTLVTNILDNAGEERDQAATGAFSNIRSTIPLSARMVAPSERVSDDMKNQYESMMKKYNEDNDERVYREMEMISLLTSIDKKLGVLDDTIEDGNKHKAEPVGRTGSGILDKIAMAGVGAPVAVTAALKGVELFGRGAFKTAELVKVAGTFTAELVKKGGKAVLTMLDDLATKPGILGNSMKFLTSSIGKISLTVLGVVVDGVLGFFKSEEWGASKLASVIGGAVSGTIDNKVLNTFVNMGKWAAVGAAAGSIVPLIGTTAGGILGAIFGGIMGWIGGQDTSKLMDEVGPSMWDKMKAGVANMFSAENVGKSIAGLYDSMTQPIIQSIEAIAASTPKALEVLKESMSASIQGFIQLAKTIAAMVSWAVSNVWDLMKDPKNMKEKIGKIVSSGLDATGSYFNDLGKGLSENFKYAKGVGQAFTENSKTWKDQKELDQHRIANIKATADQVSKSEPVSVARELITSSIPETPKFVKSAVDKSSSAMSDTTKVASNLLYAGIQGAKSIFTPEPQKKKESVGRTLIPEKVQPTVKPEPKVEPVPVQPVSPIDEITKATGDLGESSRKNESGNNAGEVNDTVIAEYQKSGNLIDRGGPSYGLNQMSTYDTKTNKPSEGSSFGLFLNKLKSDKAGRKLWEQLKNAGGFAAAADPGTGGDKFREHMNAAFEFAKKEADKYKIGVDFRGRELKEALYTLGVAGTGNTQNILKSIGKEAGKDLSGKTDPELIQLIFDKLSNLNAGKLTESVQKRYRREGAELISKAQGVTPQRRPVGQTVAAYTPPRPQQSQKPIQPVMVSQTTANQSNSVKLPTSPRQVSSNREALTEGRFGRT
jgi:hypothetical protein